jgi:hypothetical protein
LIGDNLMAIIPKVFSTVTRFAGTCIRAHRVN